MLNNYRIFLQKYALVGLLNMGIFYILMGEYYQLVEFYTRSTGYELVYKFKQLNYYSSEYNNVSTRFYEDLPKNQLKLLIIFLKF